MSLYNYLVKSRAPYKEILYAFHREEIETLYSLVKEIGWLKYFGFVRDNLQDILKYISLTDSQRGQKKWTKNPDILLIRLAALQISFSTVKLLDEIASIDAIVDAGSYRKFHSVVADALALLFLTHPFHQFPFDDYDNPFVKSSPDNCKAE